jgi:ubiquinone/menaquinone biosynthesis C-methylase UbiE
MSQVKVSDSSVFTERTAAGFDAAAASWDNPERARMAEIFADAIVRETAPGPDTAALEFGCGGGNLSLALAGRLGSVTAVDVSSEMIALASKKAAEAGAKNLAFVKGCVEDIPGRGPFDLIFSSLVLHHLPDAPGTLAALARTLKKGARLAVIELEKEDGSFHDDNSLITHFGFERDELEGIFTSAGLSDFRWTPGIYSRVKTSKDGQSRSYPMFLASGAKR